MRRTAKSQGRGTSSLFMAQSYKSGIGRVAKQLERASVSRRSEGLIETAHFAVTAVDQEACRILLTISRLPNRA